MTIRHRLTVSFLVILGLFALNQTVYFIGNQKRQATVESLRRAIARQLLISSVNQMLNDLNKQVTLISQVPDLAAGAGSPRDTAQFGEQLDKVRTHLDELHALSEASDEALTRDLQTTVAQLSQSWRIFYDNMGVNQGKAITELAVHADPLSQKVLQQSLPNLQTRESQLVEAASANFYEVAQITDRITIAIFLISTLTALVIAYLVSRYLGRGFRVLRAGAAAVGSGKLGEKIAFQSRDELGDLARAFNDMSEKLSAAHDELTRSNEQERKKSDELAAAIKQLHKAQDQLLVQQKLASLGSLTAGIAHEIKNPLNFVTNFAQLSTELIADLKDTLEVAAAQLDAGTRADVEDLLGSLEQNVTKINEHGKRADSIVRGMLMHSRAQAGQAEPTNVNALLAEYVKLAYHGMRAQDSSLNVTLEESYDPEVGKVQAVPQELGRVFLNIVNNACYAATHAKHHASNGAKPTVSVSTRNLGGSIEIRIRDNGDGVPDHIRKSIFEPFFTTKPAGSGTGLGLSLSYDIIVQGHKGDIKLDSEEGKFAEFIITLPKD